MEQKQHPLTSIRKRWHPDGNTVPEVMRLRSALLEWVEQGCLPNEFDQIEKDIEQFQRDFNPVYTEWTESWSGRFLPVEAFKYRSVVATGVKPKLEFRSSGTSAQSKTACHPLDDPSWYDAMALAGFEWQYGSIEEWEVFGLLPGYLERGNSSLVHMVTSFRRHSGADDLESGFFLRDLERLSRAVERALQKGKRVLVVGVTYACLDWVDSLSKMPLRGDTSRIVLMETGGMKGARQEWSRPALHDYLRKGSGILSIHSEYGMTELLSQAYAHEAGRFQLPPWMRVKIGDLAEPESWLPIGRRGRIYLIDLANIHSCSFIATGDVGRAFDDGTFEVLGRYDASEVRGCNLMVQ